MRFGREHLSETALTMTVDEKRGWVCSENSGHFQVVPERLWPEAAAKALGL